MELHLSESVKVRFDGQHLYVLENESQIDTFDAQIGNTFHAYPKSKKKKNITVQKVDMPAERGQKIAFALGFQVETTRCNSFEEFVERTPDAMKDIETTAFSSEHWAGAYSFLLAKRSVSAPNATPKSQRNKPLLIWISDDITAEQLDELINQMIQYRTVAVPSEYLHIL